MAKAPVVVALDARDIDTASRWAVAVEPHVSALKVGLELFCRYGPDAVASVRGGTRIDVVIDPGLHNIPSSVAGAARALARLRPRYITVHAAGGTEMIKAAVDAAPDVCITAITVLTSLAPGDLEVSGVETDTADVTRRRAAMAVAAGARGLVCPAPEVAAVRAEVGPDVVLMTPGVRRAGAEAQDQARTATPEQALRDGADLVIVGRSITGAADPGSAAASLATVLHRAGFPRELD